jgi:hypothetical protein
MATDTMVKTRFTPMMLQGTAHAPGYDAKVAKGNGGNGSGGRSKPAPRGKSVKSGKGTGLRACPFCRELFTDDETDTCPECGLVVRDLAELPPSPDAEHLQAEEGHNVPIPQAEPLPWKHMGRGRGLLLACAVVGLVAFYLPWAIQTAPENAQWTGSQMAHVKSFYWSAFTAWLVLFPAVLSRRTILKMVGARVAVVCLAAMPALVCAMLMRVPQHRESMGVVFEFHWGAGMYLTIVTSVVATLIGFRFGGKLDDVTVSKGTSRGEVVH